jgi:hypothetical protein
MGIMSKTAVEEAQDTSTCGIAEALPERFSPGPKDFWQSPWISWQDFERMILGKVSTGTDIEGGLYVPQDTTGFYAG